MQGSKRRFKQLVFVLCACGFTNSVLAGAMGPVNNNSKKYAVSISAGPVWYHAGKHTTLDMTPDITKAYVENSSTKAVANGEIFFGIEQRLARSVLGQYGFAVAATTNATFPGFIWDDAQAEFNNHSFNSKIQHNYFALKGKLLGDWNTFVLPWVSASAGLGLNYSHGFTNAPTIPEAVINPDFASKRVASFSYTLGIGAQRLLANNWQVGMGYEFADWGKSKFNRAPEQTLNSGLSRDHFYTNGLMFNISYTS